MKVWVLVDKEWAEMFRNKMVLASVFITPMAFLFLALTTQWATRSAIDEAGAEQMKQMEGEIPEFMVDICGDLDPVACTETYMGVVYLLMFLMMPLILPTAFAAYSVVGEKSSRTLEPLLAAPITTWELLAAKTIAAALPGIVATWLVTALYYAGMVFLASPGVLQVLMEPHWLLAVGVTGPVLGVIGVDAALIVSSRVNDPRTAQQISSLVLLPFLGMMGAQLFGLFALSTTTVLVGTVVLVVIAIAMSALAVALFEREAILTRWG